MALDHSFLLFNALEFDCNCEFMTNNTFLDKMRCFVQVCVALKTKYVLITQKYVKIDFVLL